MRPDVAIILIKFHPSIQLAPIFGMRCSIELRYWFENLIAMVPEIVPSRSSTSSRSNKILELQ